MRVSFSANHSFMPQQFTQRTQQPRFGVKEPVVIRSTEGLELPWQTDVPKALAETTALLQSMAPTAAVKANPVALATSIHDSRETLTPVVARFTMGDGQPQAEQTDAVPVDAELPLETRLMMMNNAPVLPGDEDPLAKWLQKLRVEQLALRDLSFDFSATSGQDPMSEFLRRWGWAEGKGARGHRDFHRYVARAKEPLGHLADRLHRLVMRVATTIGADDLLQPRESVSLMVPEAPSGLVVVGPGGDKLSKLN